jgi:glucose repression regulatory protein TUP1
MLQPRDSEAFVRALCFTPHDLLLLSGSEDGLVRVWERATARLRHVFIGHCAEAVAVDVASTDPADLVASGSADGTARIWSLDTGKCLTTLLDSAAMTGSEVFQSSTVRFPVRNLPSACLS